MLLKRAFKLKSILKKQQNTLFWQREQGILLSAAAKYIVRSALPFLGKLVSPRFKYRLIRYLFSL
jgi:hypothetical protein